MSSSSGTTTVTELKDRVLPLCLLFLHLKAASYAYNSAPKFLIKLEFMVLLVWALASSFWRSVKPY